VLLQPTSFIRQPTTRDILEAPYAHTVHIHAGTGMRDSETVDWAWLLPEMVHRGYESFLSLEAIDEPKLESIEHEIGWLKAVAG